MDIPWFRNLYRPQPRQLERTRIKANEGDAEAQFGLGLRFANGEGMAVDFTQAAHWYLKAAGQNHALAQFNLGMMLAEGQGVPRDDAGAVMWLRRAAQQGDAGAQYNLGMRQRRADVEGLDAASSESKQEAYKWFRLAAAQGYRGSKAAFESVTIGMTGAEVAEANGRVAAFVAANSALIPACQ